MLTVCSQRISAHCRPVIRAEKERGKWAERQFLSRSIRLSFVMNALKAGLLDQIKQFSVLNAAPGLNLHI